MNRVRNETFLGICLRAAPVYESILHAKQIYFTSVRPLRRMSPPPPQKKRDFWIWAITILRVLKNAITIRLFQDLPLQFHLSPVHAIFYCYRV
jgi:hypothetical protein